MDGKKTERIYYIEVLRAMAAFAVVALHVATNNWYGFIGSTDWTVFTIYGGLMKFCVPVFFMISGALFLEKSRRVSGKRLFCHNILRLVIFLVLWSFVYQMYHLAVRGEGGDLSAPAMALQAVKNIIKGDTQVHFWFLYTMIALYLALPLVKVFTDHAEKKHLEYFLILWFVLRCVAPALSGIPVLQYAYVNAAKLGVTMTGGYLGYFILGHYLHSYPPEGIKRKAVYALGVVGVLASIIITCVVCVRENACMENWFGYFFPGIAFWSAAVFLFVQSAAARPGRLSGFVKAASGCSLGIYGVHMLVLFLLWDGGISTFSFPGLLSVPVLSAAIFLCSMGITFLLSKIPVVGKIF